ncbi:hypothetical protein BX600DRAFT_507363 [Xylariales sp. PMI_506]|nr:hypothetical protein BX600DRAFT_507363 [Xylariales sp. PMI_506]
MTHEKYLTLIHTIETLLHTFSDGQLASAVSLLVALNGQACTISAYDFNVVCTMLMIGFVVHLNSLVMISDFVHKGKSIAWSLIFFTIGQLTLTGIVFSARNTSLFPFEPQSLAIMPAACFENTNAANAAGLADFIDLISTSVSNSSSSAASEGSNSTVSASTQVIWSHIEAASSKTRGLPEYAVLGSVCVSIASTVTRLGLAGYAFWRYSHLSRGMKVDEWYQKDAVEDLTLSQILPLALLMSSIFPVINAVTGEFCSLPGRSRRFTNAVQKGEKYLQQGIGIVDSSQSV